MKTLIDLFQKTLLTISVVLCAIIICHQSVWADASAEEIRQWVDIHNQFRAQHQVGPVTWSDTVAASAQAFVETCPMDHPGENDPHESDYGENLGWSSGHPPISNMVTLWYDEEERYDYSNPSYRTIDGKPLGHFTQVVWKNTTEIGCALKTGCPAFPDPEWSFTDTMTTWVCRYNPRGNNDTFAENVFPKKAAGPSSPSNLRIVSASR